ncbi:uncharacterized protein K452DRAFT_112966 [Aplosporella prunicola CBS 121167]|uniref:Uncharacterized protein n=1 Tax=Aplosporella prunicola CBS 121167 TaxID=1176127 RepID=A0A6A6B1J6_9PEZI|nr:uncharacterized protein K452DRAFT_112966 [Aplosporella prunicola CBS 121167]KAF2137135.1 hypothetical protein K452DRAFT_112966 [Aplosporella prunicola CBS 121167]
MSEKKKRSINLKHNFTLPNQSSNKRHKTIFISPTNRQPPPTNPSTVKPITRLHPTNLFLSSASQQPNAQNQKTIPTVLNRLLFYPQSQAQAPRRNPTLRTKKKSLPSRTPSAQT